MEYCGLEIVEREGRYWVVVSGSENGPFPDIEGAESWIDDQLYMMARRDRDRGR